MVKMLGSLIIIISGLIGGRLMGYQYLQRTRELQQFFNSLHMLETEISYGYTVLPLAVTRLIKISPQPHRRFFVQFLDCLQPEVGLTTDEAWQKAINLTKSNFCLRIEDWEVLRQYGQGLGASDDQNQIRQLKVVQRRLEQMEMRSREESEKMSRMWNYVGILVGIALVILLY